MKCLMTISPIRLSYFKKHPTARMLKDHLEYKELLKFDPRNDWSEWQTLYGFAHIGNHIGITSPTAEDLRAGSKKL